MENIILGLMIWLMIERFIYLIRGEGQIELKWTDKEKEWLELAESARKYREMYESNNNN